MWKYFQNGGLYFNFKGYYLERLLDVIVFSAHYYSVKMKLLKCPNIILYYIYIFVGVYNVIQLLRT